ncbi:hypothetical protein D3C75_721660 [compost metagenome]
MNGAKKSIAPVSLLLQVCKMAKVRYFQAAMSRFSPRMATVRIIQGKKIRMSVPARIQNQIKTAANIHKSAMLSSRAPSWLWVPVLRAIQPSAISVAPQMRYSVQNSHTFP